MTGRVWPTARLLSILFAVATFGRPRVCAAQRPSVSALDLPRWRFELAAASTGAYARDEGSGARVTGGVGAALGAEALWSAAANTTVSLFARAAAGQVTVDGDGYRVHPGSSLQLDAGLALEWRVYRRFGLRGGAGLVWLHGPDEVVPFRDSNDMTHWMGELGVTSLLSERRPLSAVATFQTLQLGAARVTDPVDEQGWVRRVLLGVRYGR